MRVLKPPEHPLVLALDAHGGDHGLDVTLPAAVDAMAAEPGLEIVMVGQRGELDSAVEAIANERLRFVAAESVLEADARPVTVLRQGADSSLGRAIQLVADGSAHACVSAGSTMALMALAVKFVGMLPGIRRPALMSAVPSATGATHVLDLGANLNVNAVQLVQFAIMGVEACATAGAASPRVGLLNVGHEESKGHAVVREAHERLRELELNYAGFVEGHDIFAGRVDVAVCDGFSGNLLLKSGEGLAKMLLESLRDAFDSGPRAKLGGWLARPALTDVLARFDPGKHNGAPLLGLRGVIVKSHGSADRQAMVVAMREAMREAEKQVPGRIKDRIHLYQAGEST